MLRLVTILMLATVASVSLFGAGTEGFGMQNSGQTSDQERKVQYCYLEALKQKNKGDFAEAHDLLYYCYSMDPENIAVLAELSNMSITAGKYAKAKKYMNTTLELDPDNYWVRQALAHLYLNTSENVKAAETYEDIIRRHPKRHDNYYYLANIYTRQQEYAKAVEAWDKLENAVGLNEQIAVEKFKLLVKMGKSRKAFGEIDKLIDAYPNQPKHKVLKADLYSAVGKDKQAIKLYNKILKENPNDPIINNQIGAYYLKKEEYGKSMKYLLNVLRNKDADLKLKDNILSVSTDSIMEPYFSDDIFKEMIEMHPSESFCYWRYAEFMMMKNSPAFVQYMEKALELNPDIEAGWGILYDWHLSNNDKERAEKVLKEALKHFPENGKFLYDLADLYIEQKKNTEAIDLLQKATVAFKSVNSFELASFVQGAIGDIYTSMKEMDKAFVAYDSALVLNENNITVLNNYAYYLSEKGINLDKAELMSGKAVKEESNNPSYLDTYAWIYFKKGNYTLALLYIEQAMKNGGENSVAVLEHYGDILFKSGDKEKAVKMWRNAFALDEMGVLKNGYESQASPFLKRKIEEQQYIDK